MEKTFGRKVKVGDAFLCIKDYIMDDDEIVFKKSNVYKVEFILKYGIQMINEYQKNHTLEINTDFLEHFQLLKDDSEVTDSPSKEENYDFINPNHYKSFSKEVIDMMVDIWGKDAVAVHCEITAFKYKMRAGSKPNQSIEQDIDKANWYLNKSKELKQL